MSSVNVPEKKSNIAVDDEDSKRYRRARGFMGIIERILLIGFPVYCFLYLFQIFHIVKIQIFSGVHNSLFLAAFLTLAFIKCPAKKGQKGSIPWYDFILILLSLFTCIYFAINYEEIIFTGGAKITPLEQLYGLILVLLLVEAVRRTAGIPMAIICICFFLYARFSSFIPGLFQGPPVSNRRLMNFVYFSNQGIFGSVLGIAATIIISFSTFGAFLNVSGAGELFIELSMALMGHVRGGAAKVAVIASGLMGSLSGSPTANVGITGPITIPLMTKMGYSPGYSAAINAAASTGGLIMPPMMGAVAFVMADFMGISYGFIARAALLPALLYYAALFFQIDCFSAKNGIKGIPRSELPSMKSALNGRWQFFMPLVLLAVLLMGLRYDPIYAVYYSTGFLIILGIFNKRNRLSLKRILAALEEASVSTLLIVPLCAIAGIIVAAMTLTGLGLNIGNIIITLSGNNILLMGFFTAIAIYALGMGVSNIATYILLAILVAPSMVKAGIPPLSAHFFIIFVGMSMFITPPYAPATYMASAIAGSEFFKTGFQSMRLSVVGYLVPFVCLFNSAFFFVGGTWNILSAFVTAMFGVHALSVGFEGYRQAKVSLVMRIVYLILGVLLFIPYNALSLPALGIWFLVTLYERLRMKKTRAA
jgi:TRAP transporter 4TM/12TM fusion protein